MLLPLLMNLENMLTPVVIGKRRRGRSRPRVQELTRKLEPEILEVIEQQLVDAIADQNEVLAEIAIERAKSHEITNKNLIALEAELDVIEEVIEELQAEELLVILALAV